jgi:hypothetical protein
MSNHYYFTETGQAVSGSIQAGFFTVKQTALFLSCSEKSVRRFIERGLLRPSKALRKLLIPRGQLESFFERTR